MKKGNSKDTAPKRPGRPKKKATGGPKMLKEYRNKRAQLARAIKGTPNLMPSIPTVIKSADLNLLLRSIRHVREVSDYETYREMLYDLATKVEVKIPDRPKNITAASVKKIKALVEKAEGRYQLKREYAKYRELIEALPYEVRLPRIPRYISQRNVDAIKKLYDKVKVKAPKYKDKVTVTPEDVEKSIKDLEKEAEAAEQDYGERDEYDAQYDADKPLKPNATPEPIEDEVLNAYRDFVSKALDYTEANEMARLVNNWRQDITMEFWAQIYAHGMNCLAMISKLENENDEAKRKAVQNLIKQAGYIYESSEEYLFVYTTYKLADEGASILEDIEKALREATGNEISDDEWKKWSEIHGQYGEITFDM